MFFLKSSQKKWVIDSMLNKKTAITGDITFEGGMRIDGKVIGNITGIGDNSTLFLGPSAQIEGEVQAKKVIVAGCILGPILGAQHVHIQKNGKIVGNVSYCTIQMEEGASVQGHLQLISATQSQESSKVQEVVVRSKNSEPAKPVQHVSPAKVLTS